MVQCPRPPLGETACPPQGRRSPRARSKSRTRAALFSAETASITRGNGRGRKQERPGSLRVSRAAAASGEAQGRPARGPGPLRQARDGAGCPPGPRPAGPALHLHGAFRPQVGPQHVLQAPGRADVHRQRRLGSSYLGLGVQGLHGRHG